MNYLKIKKILIYFCTILYVFLVIANPAFCLSCFNKKNKDELNTNHIVCICCQKLKNVNKNCPLENNVPNPCNHCMKIPKLPDNKEKKGLSSQQNIDAFEKILNSDELICNFIFFKANKNLLNLLNAYLPLNLNLNMLRTVILLN